MIKFTKNQKQHKDLAKKHIIDLFEQAKDSMNQGEVALSNRYVKLAKKISLKYKVNIPKEL
jgi:RNase P subunit RPR2